MAREERGSGRRGEAGFTLIELIFVSAIIAIIAAIAIPNLIESRKSSNEAAAVGFMRTITTSQEMFRDRDMDRDGAADYALNMSELRAAGLLTYNPVPGATIAQRGGYFFSVYRKATTPLEFGYGAVAVPVSFGRSGDRNFGTDERGVIYFSTTQIDFANPPDPTSWIPLGGGG